MPIAVVALLSALIAFVAGGACLWRALFNPAGRALALTLSAVLLAATTGLWLLAFVDVR